jgi:hypothetical protein
MKMNSKLPGLVTRAVSTELDLTYKQRFEDAKIPAAYEALILDAFKGDHSNFVRDDELDVAWKIFTPILHWIDGKDGMFRSRYLRLLSGQYTETIQARLPSLNLTHTDQEAPRVWTSLPPNTATFVPMTISECSRSCRVTVTES